MDQVSIVFQPYGKRASASKTDNLLDLAREAGINIRSICGGKGSCGKCKVIVRKGEIDFRYDPKEKLLTEEELTEGYALACLTQCKSDCEVLIPPESRIEGQKILSEATIPEIQVEPAVRELFIPPQQLRGKSHEQLMRSFQLLTRARSVPGIIDSKLKSIADRCGEEGATLTVGLEEPTKLLGVGAGDTSGRNFGLAVDVGCTTVSV